jgi:hypothetical protein
MNFLIAAIGSLILFAACNNAPLPPLEPCRMPEGGRLYFQPTATSFVEPVLTPTLPLTTTATPTPTPEPTLLPYCTPTPTPAGTFEPTAAPISYGRGAGDARNLTLDMGDAVLEAAAAGRYVSAVVWQEEGQLVVATTDGGSDFDSQPIGSGEQATVAYSLADRLHLAYVRDGSLYYRAADAGLHPAGSPEELIGPGSRPHLVVGPDGWAHLLYMDGDVVRYRFQGAGGWSTAQTIAAGETVSAAFSGDSVLLAAVRQGDTISIHSQNTAGGWTERASFQPGTTVLGTPHLDASGDWAYVAFVTEELIPYDGDWPNYRPEYKPAAPWANRIHSGSNAQQYFTRFAVHDAGLYQQVEVAGGLLTLTAWGQVWSTDDPCNPPDASCNPTEMRLQVGLDPTGGLNPAGDSVVWSAPANPVDQYMPLTVSAAASGPLATVFLKSNPVEPRSHNDVYWDSVIVAGGELINGDFEATFPEYNGIGELKVAEGWHPFYIEDGVMGIPTGHYILHAAWSNGGGQNWSEPFEVIRNSDGGQEQAGAFRGDAYPLIALDGAPEPSVSFLVVYQEGDPPPNQPGALRYGRVRLAICLLGSTDCTESPGRLLLPAQTFRPTIHLVAAVSPDRQRGLVAWDALQPGEAAKDVYATSIRPQEMEE